MSYFLHVLAIQMFTMPSLITISIAATWMYRSLTYFGHSVGLYVALSSHCISSLTQDDRPHYSTMDPENQHKIGCEGPNYNGTLAVPTPPKHMEVTVHTIREEYPSTQSDDSVLYIGRDHPDICSTVV